MSRWGIRAAALALVLLGSFAAQAASWVDKDHATLTWQPATGRVQAYGVWVSRNGEAFPTTPSLWVAEPRATLWPSDSGAPEQLVVRVAAFGAGGVRGPFSPASAPLVFLPPAPVAAPTATRSARPFDFDGNGATDLLWLRADRLQAVAWLMEDGFPVDGSTFSLEPGEEIVGSGDFDGDGRADLVLDRANGGPVLWFMEGREIRERRLLPGWAGFDAEAVGDFDGDGYSDLFGRIGNVAVVLMLRNAVVVDDVTLGVASGNPQFAAPDLDGDGLADLFFHDASRGFTWAWQIDESWRVTASRGGPPWANAELVGCADANADGRDDLLWHRPGSGGLRFWFMDGLVGESVISWTLKESEHVHTLGDYDGDGVANESLMRDAETGDNWIARFDWDGASSAIAPRRHELPRMSPELWTPVRH